MLDAARTFLSGAPARRRHRLVLPPTPLRRAAGGALLALGAAVLLTLVLLALRGHLSTANDALFYILPVLAGATFGGLLPGVLAAIACAVTFDLLFIQPYGALSVASGQDLLTLVVYLGTGALVAQLAGQARARAEEAARRASTNALLYDLSSVFLAGDLDAVLKALVERLAGAFDLGACAVLLPDDRETLEIRAHWGTEAAFSNPEHRRQVDAVAAWAYSQGEQVGLSLDRTAQSGSVYRRAHNPPTPEASASKESIVFMPLRTGAGRNVGVLALTRPLQQPFTAEETSMLATFATQAALAVDRARLAGVAAQAVILRESDRAKSSLLSNVSHDLRTPLTTIRAAAESLLAPDMRLDNQTRAELLLSVRDEADRLSSMVANLLSLSRLEAGALRPDPHLYDLADLTSSTIARLRPLLGGRRISMNLPEQASIVSVDDTLFEQVLLNVLDNAAKYSPPGSPIRVDLRREGAQAILRITDEGPGIPRSARNQVFEHFYRDPATSGGVPGTGLGLAICKALITAHNGRIWIEDTEGNSTTVGIALPLSTQTADPRLATAGVDQ